MHVDNTMPSLFAIAGKLSIQLTDKAHFGKRGTLGLGTEADWVATADIAVISRYAEAPSASGSLFLCIL